MSRENVPSRDFVAVTPHDTTNFTHIPRAIYVGTTGNVAAVDSDGTAVTFVGVPAGAFLPIRPTRINNTNTTASDIVALY